MGDPGNESRAGVTPPTNFLPKRPLPKRFWQPKNWHNDQGGMGTAEVREKGVKGAKNAPPKVVQ